MARTVYAALKRRSSKVLPVFRVFPRLGRPALPALWRLLIDAQRRSGRLGFPGYALQSAFQSLIEGGSGRLIFLP